MVRDSRSPVAGANRGPARACARRRSPSASASPGADHLDRFVEDVRRAGPLPRRSRCLGRAPLAVLPGGGPGRAGAALRPRRPLAGVPRPVLRRGRRLSPCGARDRRDGRGRLRRKARALDLRRAGERHRGGEGQRGAPRARPACSPRGDHSLHHRAARPGSPGAGGWAASGAPTQAPLALSAARSRAAWRGRPAPCYVPRLPSRRAR